MKKMFVVGLLAGVSLSVSVNAITPLTFYKRLCKREEIGRIETYWCENLTGRTLRNRGDKIIIEKCVGTVLNTNKDGRIMNPHKKGYDYISYRCVKNAKPGDTILSVFIYEPGGNDVDEIVDRFDYIIDRR